jgi:hypothetical protein
MPNFIRITPFMHVLDVDAAVAFGLRSPLQELSPAFQCFHTKYLNIVCALAIIQPMLKPQDIVVAVKLAAYDGPRPSFQQLASQLRMFPSEVHTSFKRAKESGFITGSGEEERVNRSSLLEFLVHGLRYSFPPERGAPTRGVPTSYAADPLKRFIVQGTGPPPVWPSRNGKVRGFALKPLHKNVPEAVADDPGLYEFLALIDAVRDGRSRERTLAVRELEKRLSRPSHE